MNRFSILWLYFSVWCVLLGWTLSVIGQLNLYGYLAGFVVFLVSLYLTPVFRREIKIAKEIGRIYRRLRHPLVASYYFLVILIFISAIFYRPDQVDGLSYRIPRIMQWIMAGKWHWINSYDPRLNNHAFNFEWLAVPILLISKSDRLLFLINFIPYLLLPGLVFSFLKALAVSPRVAWYWMWILPSGLCFILQTRGIGDDAIGAFYVCIAILAAIKCKESRSIYDLFISIASISFATGIKQTMVPLLLPWAIAVFPSLVLIRYHKWKSILFLPICVLISAFPISYLNKIHYGDWTGLASMPWAPQNHELGLKLIGNLYLIIGQNLQPPLFPWATNWNIFAIIIVYTGPLHVLNDIFESRFLLLYTTQDDQTAGIGMGVTIVLIYTLIRVWRMRQNVIQKAFDWHLFWIHVAAWVAFTVVLLSSSLVQISRLISPYYIVIVARLLLSPNHLYLIRSKHWKLLVIFPPYLAILFLLFQIGVGPSSIDKSQLIYVRARDNTSINTFLATLDSPEPAHVALARKWWEVEAPFWQPYGKRSVEYIRPTDSIETLHERHLTFIIISLNSLNECGYPSIRAWLNSHPGRLLGSADAYNSQWYFVTI